MNDHVSPQVLTMPLSELRERVELAERLAIANRHALLASTSGAAPSAASGAGTPTGAQAGAAGKPRGRPPSTPAPAAAPTTSAEATSDDLDAAFGSGQSSGGDFGDGGDMLADFVEELTPDQARAATTAIAQQVIGKKEKAELTQARDIMQKYGVQKVSEIPEDKIIEAYGLFRNAFPQYVQ